MCIPHNMDYRQKMVLAPNKTRITDNGEDDDDEDLEALRMAALQSLRAKDTPRLNPQIWPQTNRNTQQMAHLIYKERRQPRQSLYQTSSTRQNGGLYFQRHRNPNLIAIVPVEEDVAIQKCEPAEKLSDRASPTQNHEAEESKFCRYKDEPSCSEEEDDNVSDKLDVENSTECPQTGVELSDLESTHGETSEHSEEDEKEEDDDDVLLMADLEEEDSLERLMDEMEKEMSVDKPTDVKRHSKKENKSAKKEETNSKRQTARTKLETRIPSGSPAGVVSSSSVPCVIKNEPLSPYNRSVNRRRSLSPKPRSRRKSPRKSPRRSPPRQFKKSVRDGREPLRYRSPRKSPSRFSPRPRSPRLSPRRSSPRLSPRLSPYHRLPCRIPRSRSPRMSPRPRSPRSRSPRSPPQRSPARLSPRKLSPPPRLTRSPKLSPRHRSPRLSPRPRSPRLSPRPRSPRLSPRRASPRRPSPRSPLRRQSPRARSPGLSPHRSPWSSPRNSPHLSPRRRRSPKELSRKVRPRSVTPASRASPISKRGSSPNTRAKNSPDNFVKSKLKQKEELHEKAADAGKGTDGVINDPVLEARRRKFESVKPIDPINANKKIKLSRNEKKSNIPDETKVNATNLRTEVNEEEEYEMVETDSYLGADFEFEQDVEDAIEDSPAATIASAVNVCSEIEPAKLERERPVKKKKKKDKELYQVHKGELPLSERIGKEKKCKKRKQVPADSPVVEKTETIFEDLTVDEEEGDLRTELSRRRAERLNRTAPIHQQSVRLVQSAFKGVVSEVVKSNAKSIRKQLVKGADDKQNHKGVRRVTVLHRPDLHESEDETIVDSKVPVRFRLGLNKAAQDTRESKVSRKNSKRQSRKE